MNPIAEDILMHYGVKFRSGRYPWGSGDTPYQHGEDFLARVEELKKQGFKENAESIKREFGITMKQYRNEKALAQYERDSLLIDRAKSLSEDGLGPTEIGRRMGRSESTVRGWLEPNSDAKIKECVALIDHIRTQVDKNKMVDVGKGVDKELHISEERLDLALHALQREGYPVYNRRVEQSTNAGFQTTNKIICSPGTEYAEVYKPGADIHPLNEEHYVAKEGGTKFKKFEYPASMDSSRIKIRYVDEVGPDGFTGGDKDGTVEIRRGVKDVSLGNDHYAQVRILVDGTHYVKGMAVHTDDEMPEGVDIIFNTNKPSTKSKMEVLKEIDKKNPDNPFGALIMPEGQSYYTDENGKEQLSLINKKSSEGDWSEWQDALPSQFLGKQSLALINKQLDLAKTDKRAEFEEICALENPTIKKYFLAKFADECDSAAVHLKAAALPGQKYHVILPINTLKDNEVFAPQYENGTKLALIRYPHAGTFEIPVLTVNNKNALGSKWIGKQSIDAVGINKKIADQLSGADFDGDTVMCIPTHDPTGKVKVVHRPPLQDLEGFDPKLAYPAVEGMRYMKDPATGKDNTQMEMGKISNLITDMTLNGASEDELARAVRHSMVVIDAGKHKLDYKKSEKDNDIKSLRATYQIKVMDNGEIKYGGASTLLSRAKSEVSVLKRQGSPKINIKGTDWYDPTKPEGANVYKLADDLYYPEDRHYDKNTGMQTLRTTNGKKLSYNTKDPAAVEKYALLEEKDPKTGKYAPVLTTDPATGEPAYSNKDRTIFYRAKARTQKSTAMMETDDALSLLSPKGDVKEKAYANYANEMKALANEARKTLYFEKDIQVNKEAKKTYANEIATLKASLNEALKNAPRERYAQRQADAAGALMKLDDPNIKAKELSKRKTQVLQNARAEVGSVSRKDRNIDISDREWEAIQAGAIGASTLNAILANTDIDKLRERATPKATTTVTQNQISRMKALAASNYSLEEIAKKMGKSPSTVSKYLKGVK